MLLKQNARPVDDNPPNVARPSIPPPTAASVFQSGPEMEIIPAAGKDFLCKPFLLYCRLLGITIRSKYVFGKGFGGRKGSNPLSIRNLLVNGVRWGDGKPLCSYTIHFLSHLVVLLTSECT